MKHINKILFAFSLMVLFTSCRDELDQLAGSDFAPGILSATPSDGGSAAKSKFEIKIVFVDGAVSPLNSATVTLSDDEGTEILTVTKDLSGTKDSVVVDKATLAELDLPIGVYNLSYSAKDSKDQVIEENYSFSLTPLDFPANNLEMYVAGTFNGWGWDEMTLVGDNTWEVKEITMDGGPWKFKNDKDWGDKDWGDPDCDGVVQLTTGEPDLNSDCGHSGLVNVTFNDETLEYTIEPSVLYEQNITSLFFVGTINNFTGSDYEFSQTADNTWFLEGIHLMPQDQFKFSEKSDFSGVNFGDDEMDGKVEMYGNNMVLAGDFTEGLYSITFNDKSREYTIDFVKYTTIGIIGDATIGVTGGDGWGNDGGIDADMTDNGDGTFGIVIPLTVGEVKFRNGNASDLDWGGIDFPSGTAVVGSPDNIKIDVAALYSVSFNPTTGEYSFTLAELYLVGGSTSAGWDPSSSIPFTYKEGETFEIYAYLTADDGGFKFLEIQDWAGDWGMSPGNPGVLEQNEEDNVTVAVDGFYRIIVDFSAGTYSVTESNWAIIGSATPNGWNDPDSNMVLSSATKGNYTWTVDITLVDGEIKFRENDAWDINYGDTGADGILDAGGDNIAVTAGTYTITMTLDPVAGYTYTIL